MGTLLLASEMPVPIPRYSTVASKVGFDNVFGLARHGSRGLEREVSGSSVPRHLYESLFFEYIVQ